MKTTISEVTRSGAVATKVALGPLEAIAGPLQLSAPTDDGDGWRDRQRAARHAEILESNRLRATLNPIGQPAIMNQNQLYARLQDWVGKLWGLPFARRAAGSAPLVARAAVVASQFQLELGLAQRLRSRNLRQRLSDALREVQDARGVSEVSEGMAVTIPAPDDLPESTDDAQDLADGLRRVANKLVEGAGLTKKLASHAPAGRKGVSEARALIEAVRRNGLPSGFDATASVETTLAKLIAALGFVLTPGDFTPGPFDRRDEGGRRRPQRRVDQRPFFYPSESAYLAALKDWRRKRQETIRQSLRYAVSAGKT